MKNSIRLIIEHVGGKDNIQELSHCATRLRFNVNNPTFSDIEKLKTIEGVMGVNVRGNQVQVIIGNEVERYFIEANNQLGTSGKADDGIEKVVVKKSVLDHLVELSSSLFVPIIGIMAACGTLQGFINLAVAMNWLSRTSGTFAVLNTIADSTFYYLPIYLAYNAGKYFGGRPFYSMTIALILIHPNILALMGSDEAITFIGIPLTVFTYAKTVLPVIFSSWVASVIEKYARKVIPDVLKMIVVPMLVFVITVPLTLIVIGPVFTQVMSFITNFVLKMYELSPIITGAVVGFFWQPLVLVGVSKAFMPIFPTNLATLGYDPFVICTFFAAVFGQAGAVFGYTLKSKSKRVKQVGFAATLSAIFGITEPALFGINLTAKKPLMFGAIAGGIGGLIASVLGIKAFSIGTGLLGFPALINPNGIDSNLYLGVVVSVLSFVIATVLTYLFGWSKEADELFEKSPSTSN